MGIKSTADNFFNGIQVSVNNFLRTLKPTYTVNAITYFVIPGVPLQKNVSKHDFGKGELEKAKGFFNEVIGKTKELGLAPVDIQLVKGKKSIIEQVKIGPVDQVLNTIK